MKEEAIANKEGQPCVFISSTPSVIVAPPAPPPPPPTPGWTVLTHPLLPLRQTNVISFVDLVRLRSGPLSLCGGLILLWATVGRAPYPALAPAKRGVALSQALGLRVSWPQDEQGSAFGNTCPTHHIPPYTGLQATALHGNLLQWPLHSRAGRGDGGGLDITSAKDMRLLCLLHVLWHIHYWECKWKCSSNMLKNSQGAGRVGVVVFPCTERRTKGPEGVTFSGAGAGEREGTDFMPFVDGG